MPIKLFMKGLIILSLAWLSISGCKDKNNLELTSIEGEAQGTTYHISYYIDGKVNLKPAVDSIVRKIDSSLSTYLPVSIISRINRNEEQVVTDNHFKNVFTKSLEVSTLTNGKFDVTVAPIINVYGFGFSKRERVNNAMIDSLLQFVGYGKVKMEGGKIIKDNPSIMLDFNAIAQGYTVDVIGAYLESKGIKNYFVELGGEVIAKGKKDNGENWKVGIDKPNENETAQREMESILTLKNQALATSGNYRKFYVEDGHKYSHIIDPATGYPAKNNLLSASVVAADCMTADAFATAFMVMGLEQSQQFLQVHKNLNLEVFFIYDDKGEWKTFTSEKLKKQVEVLH